MRLTLITGGVRAGKSRYAQARASELGGFDVTYVATAVARDDEMRARVARHRAERPREWRNVERSSRVGAAVHEAVTPLVIVDCITMLAADAMLRKNPTNADDAIRAVLDEVGDLLAGCSGRDGTLLVVTNEVGLSVHPPTALGRWFADALGLANQRLASAADEVVMLVSGLPLVLKAGALRQVSDAHA